MMPFPLELKFPSSFEKTKNVRTIFLFLILVLGFPLNSIAQIEKPGTTIQENYDSGELESYADPFMQAEHLFHSGEFMAAKPFYHLYLQENVRGERGPKALFRLGKIDQNAKSFSTALRFYKLLLKTYPGTLLVNDINFNMAICYFETGNLEAAEDLFKRVVKRSPDKKKKWEARYFLSRLDEMRASFENSIEKLKEVYMQADDKAMSQQAFRVAEELINSRLGERVLTSLTQKYQNGFPADLLLLKQLSLYREKGDVAGYKSALNKFLLVFPGHEKSEDFKKDLETLQAGDDSKVEVGVVLPLTGKLAATGQKVLQGIQLAYSLLPESARKKIFLNVKNSSDSIGVKNVVSGLGRNPKTVGVLGPLLSDEIKQVGGVAEKFKLSIFSPTASSAGLVDTNPYVFRNALTRKIQARFLADYSVNNLNLRRFVILYPMEPFGEELKDEFLKAVEGFGAEVVGISSYDRTQTDFKNQILELGGIADDDLERITRKQLLDNQEQKDFSDSSLLSRPKVDMEHYSEDKIENLKVSLELGYDAMFIPGVYDKVGLIIPQLVFYNIEKIALLGANGWNSPELIKMGGKFLKSIYFVDGFFSDSHKMKVRKFVEQFQNNFGEFPSHLSAQAYDAAGIMFKSITSGALNRLKLRESLVKVKNYPGVTGKTNLMESGDSEKIIFALTVRGKKIAEEN